MGHNSYIDFSAGDPRLSFKAAAIYACDISDDDMRIYTPYTSELHSKYLDDAKGFFREMGLRQSDGTEISTDSLSIMHGTTQGYEAVLKVITSRFNKLRELSGNSELKPVILMTLPTYGRLLAHPMAMGMEIVPVKREIENNWKLESGEVANILKDIRESGNRVAVAFFDSNPHNPTGLVRDSAETKSLSDVFCQHNEIMRIKNLTKRDSEKNLGCISIIDDMVYYGLEYDVGNKAVSFMTDERMYNSTYLLLGTSKIGLPALRGGLVVCNEADTKLIHDYVVNDCYCPNITTLRAVSYAFSAKVEETLARETHLQKLREAHLYGELLLRSLVNGVPRAELDTSVGERLLATVVPVVQSVERARGILHAGLPELELLTQPQSGFFHLARLKKGVHLKHQGKPICDDDALEMLLKDHGLLVATSKWCGWDNKGLFLRLSYGMPADDLVRCAVQTRAAFDAARL